MDFPELRGKRIVLTSISLDGLQDFYEYSKNPSLYKYFEFDVQKSIQESEQYLKKLIERSESETGYYWFIKHKKENKIIGTFGVLDIDPRKRSAEIGCGLSPSYWGYGYFNETLQTILTFLFKQENFHRIWAKTHFNNTAALKAFSMAGFKEEGRLRDFYLFLKNGKYYDAIVCSILEHEF